MIFTTNSVSIRGFGNGFGFFLAALLGPSLPSLLACSLLASFLVVGLRFSTPLFLGVAGCGCWVLVVASLVGVGQVGGVYIGAGVG